MRTTRLLLCFALLCSMFATACSNSGPTKDMGEIYSLALDALMPMDEGLNGDMQFIAIDMSNFINLNEKDKEQILNHFGKYNVEVMEATYEELKEKGLYDPKTNALYGILLRVQETQISDQQVIVECSKYRSGLGAIGVKVSVEYKKGEWQVTKTDLTWIS